MKTLILFLLISISSPLFAQDTPPPPLTTAVLDFQTTGENLNGKGAQTAILLGATLSASPQLILVERQDIEKILGEQELGASGLVSPDSAAKIGNLTGAKVLVTGRLFQAGDKYFLVAKVMSSETSRVYGETATFNDPGALDKAVTELAGKIATLIEKRADTLAVKVEDPSAQIDRLKKLVAGKTLPSVAVSISEQHMQRPVIDPAVETKLSLCLQQIGFDVVDQKTSSKQPAVRITGEAFSEYGARHGNLISCRARVEIKVIETASGKLLFADRQTDVADDLSEHIAAKKALENAARKLLDRIVPKLVSP